MIFSRLLIGALLMNLSLWQGQCFATTSMGIEEIEGLEGLKEQGLNISVTPTEKGDLKIGADT